MSWIPTFRLPSFPSLPSLPSISLPPNLQHRLISHLLRLSLSRYIKPSSLDFDKIEGQVFRDGNLRFERLELEEAVLEGLIPDGVAVGCGSGWVEGCAVRLPLPNLWTAPFGIRVNKIVIELEVKPESTRRLDPALPNSERSLLEISRTFTQTSLSPAELQSLEVHPADARTDLVDPFVMEVSDPAQVPEEEDEEEDPIAPGGFPSSRAQTSNSGDMASSPVAVPSLISSVIEGLLMKLTVDVDEVVIRLRHAGVSEGQAHLGRSERPGSRKIEEEGGGLYELRMAGLRYRSKTSKTGADNALPDSQSIRRIITVEDASGWITLDRSSGSAEQGAGRRSEFGTGQVRSKSLMGRRDRRRSSSSTETDGSGERTPTPRHSPRPSGSESEKCGSISPFATSGAYYPAPATLGAGSSEPLEREDSREEDEEDEDLDLDDMMMSRGIADLRESVVIDERSSIEPSQGEQDEGEDSDTADGVDDHSVYGSAIDFGPPRDYAADNTKHAALPAGAPGVSFSDRAVDESSPPDSRDQLSSSVPPSKNQRKVFSLGQDGLTVSSATPSPQQGHQASSTPSRSEILLGDVSVTFRPEEVFALLSTGHAVMRGWSNIKGPRAEPGKSRDDQSRDDQSRDDQSRDDQDLALRVRSWSLKIHYSVNSIGPSGQSAKSSPHLGLTVTGIAAEQEIRSGNPRERFAVHDIHLFEWDGGKSARILNFDPGIGAEYVLEEMAERPLLRNRTNDGASQRPCFRRADTGARQETDPGQRGGNLSKGTESSIVMEANPSNANIAIRPFQIAMNTDLVERILPFLRRVSNYLDASNDDRSSNKSQPLSRLTTTAVELQCIRFILAAPPIPDGRPGLRSGNLVTDIHAISFKDVRSGSDPRHDLSITAISAALFHENTSGVGAHAVLILNGLVERNHRLRHNRISLSLGASPDLTLPSIQLFLDRAATEGLQYYANDMASWLDGQLRDGDSSPRRDLKMIGSRFFAPANMADSASSTSSESDDTYGKIGSLTVSDLRCRLTLPRDDGIRHELVLLARTVTVVAQTAPDVQGVGATVTVQELSGFDRQGEESKDIAWTSPSKSSEPQPCLTVNLSTKTATSPQLKEASTKVDLSNLQVWLDPLSDRWKLARLLLKPPPGIFQDMVPSDVSSLTVQALGCIVFAAGGESDALLGLVMEDCAVKLRLVADARETLTRMDLKRSRALALDRWQKNLGGLVAMLADGGVWAEAGFVELLRVEDSHVAVRQDKFNGRTSIDVVGGTAVFALAADSRGSLLEAARGIAREWSNGRQIQPLGGSDGLAIGASQKRGVPVSLHSESPSTSIFQSIDAEAFAVQVGALKSDLGRSDLLSDDVPIHPVYLDNGSTQLPSSRKPQRGVARLGSLPTSNMGEEDCRVEILDETPFRLACDHYSELEQNAQKPRVSVAGTTFELRVSSLDVSFHLFDGYDWAATRSHIETKVRTMRRNLIKLRQALATGQRPQGPSETTESYLYDSIVIGLPEDTDMDDQEMAINAIDEELEILSADPNDFGSVKTSSTTKVTSAVPPGLRGKAHRRLTRSGKHQIEWILKDVVLDMTSYAPGSFTAGKTKFECGDMQIIDHIRTSTWKSFLTEWRPDRTSSMREARAKFLQVELMDLLPPGSSDTESRLRIKVLPLRFHIDQDAVTFLNRFLSFNPEYQITSEEANPPSRAARGRFFQHVEIFPVEVKVDYKPKRVDFAALSKGKLGELLNLFQFDGSKMVLRHVTLNGVSGWSTVYSNLCEIWAPDVTANQLSDVFGGVAPIRSMVNLGTGMADLILLPVSSYKRTGTLAKGLQRGTAKLAKHTASDALNLGLQIATGTQIILEQAANVLGANFDHRMDVETMEDSIVLTRDGQDGSRARSRNANQPENASQGMVAAYQSLAKNLSSAAQTILAIPMEVYESTGEQSPAKMVVRAVPIAMLKTMIGVTDASRQAMFGLKNEFRPGVKAEMQDKYKDNVRK